MTRSLVMPVVTLQTPLQRLEAAELAAWFDGADTYLPITEERGVGVERWGDRLVYEWTRTASSPRELEPAGFYRWRCGSRDEALELLEGRVPAAMQAKVDEDRARHDKAVVLEASAHRLSAEERAKLDALVTQYSLGGEGVYSPANREVDTKAKKRRRTNAALKAASDAANRKALL